MSKLSLTITNKAAKFLPSPQTLRCLPVILLREEALVTSRYLGQVDCVPLMLLITPLFLTDFNYLSQRSTLRNMNLSEGRDPIPEWQESKSMKMIPFATHRISTFEIFIASAAPPVWHLVRLRHPTRLLATTERKRLLLTTMNLP